MTNKDRHKIIPSSYLILIKDNKTLLSLRQNTGYEDGKYGLVAGHVEAGETFTRGLIREAKEEAGIELDEGDVEVVYVMHRDSKEPVNNERIDVFFIARNWRGEITNLEPRKCGGLDWFDLNNLPENVIPYIREVLTNLHQGMVYREFGWE